MASLSTIRATFLDYFAGKGHSVVPSAPLVPRNDPTLMFVNSGMVPFKNIFTGAERPFAPRAASSQKSVRAGGKHNDLDNVGYTARHHTFFEMLGNFSFGDYFKEEAIALAWHLLTREFGLPPGRLTVTVYSEDNEAHALWRRIAGLPDERIIRIATADNFWSMGDTGPCGPCSEVFFDHGPRLPGGPPGSADADGDRFVEVWNLVFMQYEQRGPDDRVALPRPSIDTGMGLERIAAVLQGVADNYDIDLFRTLIAASVAATGRPAEGEARASHRIIADHLRASAFLIADGVLPANEGRGYVLRRIMRRAMRHAHLLGAQTPLMHRLVPTLAAEMGAAYPELIRGEALIAATLEGEENRFRETLARGLGLLDEASGALSAGATLPGDIAFRLYDTYGFPLDLTEDALRARGIRVDRGGFDSAMARQRAEARAAWSGSGDAASDTVWSGIREAVPPTEFLGYTVLDVEASVVAIVTGDRPVDQLKAGETATIVTNQTPFYGLGGGQTGDQGLLTRGKARFAVADTVKPADGLIGHRGTLKGGTLKIGDSVRLSVDAPRRALVRANHSATHVLHEALRRTLGDHVAQRGSAVLPGRLRFDFTHGAPIDAETLAAIEDEANAISLQNAPVETRLMAVADATALGARALFGEKYGDEVRVVSMGHRLDAAPGAYSIELCGGTHVARTGDIGLILIVSESGVSSGVRRIEALTGDAARRQLTAEARALRDVAAKLRVSAGDVSPRIAVLLEERRRLERDLAAERRKDALGSNQSATAGATRQIGGAQLLFRAVSGIPVKDLRGLVDEGKQQIGSGVVAIVGVGEDGKAGLVVGVTADLTPRLSAVDLARSGAVALGGTGGGGRPDMAQAGGPAGDQAPAALEAIAATMEHALGQSKMPA